mgnify:CR=1 FL=1
MKYITIILYLFMTIHTNAQETIYDINIKSIDGKNINLNMFKGKYILFVNVASKCGFTSQYKELESLHKTYNDK